MAVPVGPEHRWSSGLGVRRPPLSPPAKAGHVVLLFSPICPGRASLLCLGPYSGIAQLEEYLVLTQGVVGSNPAAAAICSNVIMVVGPLGKRVLQKGVAGSSPAGSIRNEKKNKIVKKCALHTLFFLLKNIIFVSRRNQEGER